LAPDDGGMLAWQRGDAARRFGARFFPTKQWKRQAVPGADVDCMGDSTQLWMEVLMQCFVGGLVTSVTCIGVTRGHSRL